MIRINLLPFRAARKKENVRRQLSVFLLSFFLVVIVAGWFSHYLSAKVNALNATIKETRAKVEKYNKINKEIEEIKRKLDILNKKIEVIRSLDLTRKAPVALLSDMSQLVVDKQMWLTHIQDRANNVQVTGIALDNPTVAEYMTRIEASDRYTHVKLISINQDTSFKGLSLKRFDIRFDKAPLKTELK
ncbi:Fimbrial assembly family protein [Desulfosarcina cetonica]|nr:Fimbrial assembly family protein [Desulfosarcina cetonica]